jgi:hypothetical protein
MVRPVQNQACPFDINRQEAKSSVSINRMAPNALPDFFRINKQLHGAGLKAELKKF